VSTELLDHVTKLRRCSGIIKTAAGVVYGHRERELHTRSVGAIESVREERRTLTTVRSGERAQGLKPFGVAQECGNRDTRNPKYL
jgi:hypothetical protein